MKSLLKPQMAIAIAVVLLTHDQTAYSEQRAPLKVYVLCGQSNMQGHAHIRTFEHVGMDPKTAPLLSDLQNNDGSPVVCKNVWISSIGSSPEEKAGRLTVGYGAEAGGPKIGPEFTFGITMQKLVDEPILLIKTAWGGKSIHTDFRPPSAGPYVFTEAQLENFRKQNKDLEQIKAERSDATGRYYRLTIEHVRAVLDDIKRVYPEYNEEQGYKLSGFVWFQGWNDMVDRGVYPDRDRPGGYDEYSKVLTHFIRDIRKDLSAPGLPFVIGVMGAGGPISRYTPNQKRYASIHQNFRDAMAAPASLPEFTGNVVAVQTERFWDDELHQLRYRDDQIRQRVRQMVSAGDVAKNEASETAGKLRSEEFTDREIKILETAVSNFEFHYLGSAKIIGQIGKAFAKALFEISGEN